MQGKRRIFPKGPDKEKKQTTNAQDTPFTGKPEINTLKFLVGYPVT